LVSATSPSFKSSWEASQGKHIWKFWGNSFLTATRRTDLSNGYWCKTERECLVWLPRNESGRTWPLWNTGTYKMAVLYAIMGLRNNLACKKSYRQLLCISDKLIRISSKEDKILCMLRTYTVNLAIISFVSSLTRNDISVPDQ
jgi:hypothetical protein